MDGGGRAGVAMSDRQVVVVSCSSRQLPTAVVGRHHLELDTGRRGGSKRDGEMRSRGSMRAEQGRRNPIADGTRAAVELAQSQRSATPKQPSWCGPASSCSQRRRRPHPGIPDRTSGPPQARLLQAHQPVRSSPCLASWSRARSLGGRVVQFPFPASHDSCMAAAPAEPPSRVKIEQAMSLATSQCPHGSSIVFRAWVWLPRRQRCSSDAPHPGRAAVRCQNSTRPHIVISGVHDTNVRVAGVVECSQLRSSREYAPACSQCDSTPCNDEPGQWVPGKGGRRSPMVSACWARPSAKGAIGQRAFLGVGL